MQPTLQHTDPRAASLPDVVSRCAEETRQFVKRVESTFRHCYEMFRRAIQERNEDAWEAVLAQYRGLMLSWVSRHPAVDGAGEDADYFVNGACARLWESIPPERFERFPDVRSLLRYLQMCLHSAITDFARQHAAVTVSLDDAGEEFVAAPQESGLDRAARHELWAKVAARLKDDKERLVMRGLFVLGLKPRELCDLNPGVFRGVQEVYGVRENVVDRLARDPELRAYWAEHA